MKSNFKRRIESSIEEHFKSFQQQNEEKRKSFIVCIIETAWDHERFFINKIDFQEKANLHNEKICSEIEIAFEKTILNGIENMNAQNLDDFCKQAHLTALQRVSRNHLNSWQN